MPYLFVFVIAFVLSTGVLACKTTQPKSPTPPQIDMSELAGVFITEWDTAQDGVTDNHSIQLPLVEDGIYDFIVDWGDGTQDRITRHDQAEVIHRYDMPGEYVVQISGQLDGWKFPGVINREGLEIIADGDQAKLLTIKAWGSLLLADGGGQFIGASNMRIVAEDRPNLSGVTRLDGAFAGCSSLETVPDMHQWDVSSVTSMAFMFVGATSFNQPLNDWNVSNVNDMSAMFRGAESFNQQLNGWDVSNVTDMSIMFVGATSFNQPLDGWDVSNVRNMSRMFAGTPFNQSLNGWDVSNVRNMSRMFAVAKSFNQSLNEWDVSNVATMALMFANAESFNQPLDEWDVSNVTNMAYMFRGAEAFEYCPGAVDGDDAWREDGRLCFK